MGRWIVSYYMHGSCIISRFNSQLEHDVVNQQTEPHKYNMRVLGRYLNFL